MAKILVVDDDPIIVDLLKQFLEKKNYAVVTASDGLEALENVRQESPKAVLLDIWMPSKSGLQVLKEIKEYNKDIGVILVTGVTDKEIGRVALGMGASDHIIKPFDLEYLEKVLWVNVEKVGETERRRSPSTASIEAGARWPGA
ncbi:MAG: response regulator [Acidobacteria bacterium]|nr:response regulator [Acidobacteriota bacterium]